MVRAKCKSKGSFNDLICKECEKNEESALRIEKIWFKGKVSDVRNVKNKNALLEAARHSRN